jgi:hypothetical protein
LRALRDVLGVMVVVMMVLALISGLPVIVARVWPPDETRLRAGCQRGGSDATATPLMAQTRPELSATNRNRRGASSRKSLQPGVILPLFGSV